MTDELTYEEASKKDVKAFHICTSSGLADALKGRVNRTRGFGAGVEVWIGNKWYFLIEDCPHCKLFSNYWSAWKCLLKTKD